MRSIADIPQMRKLVEISYDAAQQGINRHVADISSTRNWFITGVLVYCGTIATGSSPIYFWSFVPVLGAIIVGIGLTVYERGNAELMKQYCREAEAWLRCADGEVAENGPQMTSLEKWMMDRDHGWKEKLALYWNIFHKKWMVWLPLVFLAAVAIVATIGLRATVTQGTCGAEWMVQ